VAPDTIIVVVVIAIATTLQIAGLVSIAFQVRRMNDKMIADDASIFLQGRQGQEILREMREILRNQS
jgi:predicted DNA repair protein MutK